MEHKRITGGEHLLPFARSRIRALRATGMLYASQQFEVDGVSVKVRIEPGHEYIVLDGDDRKFWMLYTVYEASYEITGYLGPSEASGMQEHGPPLPSGDITTDTKKTWLCKISKTGAVSVFHEGATQTVTTRTFAYGNLVDNADGGNYYVSGRTTRNIKVGGSHAISDYCVYGGVPVMTFGYTDITFARSQYGNGFNILAVEASATIKNWIEWGKFSEEYLFVTSRTITGTNDGTGGATTVVNSEGEILTTAPYFVDPTNKSTTARPFAVACFSVMQGAIGYLDPDTGAAGYGKGPDTTYVHKKLLIAGDKTVGSSIIDDEYVAPLRSEELVPRPNDYSRREAGLTIQGHNFIQRPSSYFISENIISNRNMVGRHQYVKAVTIKRDLVVAPSVSSAGNPVYKFSLSQWRDDDQDPGWYKTGKPIDITKVKSLKDHPSVGSSTYAIFDWTFGNDGFYLNTPIYRTFVSFKSDQKDAFDKSLRSDSI